MSVVGVRRASTLAKLLALGVVLCASMAATTCVAAEEVVVLPTRGTQVISYLLVHDTGTNPKVIVVSFVGSRGAIGLQRRAESGALKFGPGANFLVRVRDQFADQDFVDAIVDSPADQLPDGMSDAFRMSKDHATDIRAVINDLKTRYPTARIFLVGTSRGTISVAALAASLGGTIQGVVLTSTVTGADKTGAALSNFDFSSIKVPALLLHHRADGCPASPYAGAERVATQFPAQFQLISVSGGNAPQSGPCDPLAPHGYFGRERATIDAIKHWMLGQGFARDIN